MCCKCKVNISYIESLGIEIGLMILGRIRIQLRSWVRPDRTGDNIYTDIDTHNHIYIYFTYTVYTCIHLYIYIHEICLILRQYESARFIELRAS